MSTLPLGRKTKKSLLIILLLNLAAAFGYVFLFTSVKATNEHISNLVNEIDAGATAENLKQATSALVVETLPLRDKLSGYLVSREEAVSFLEFLEQTGSGIG